MKKESLKLQNENEPILSVSFDLAKDVITKDYIYKLSEYEAAELPAEFRDINIADYTRIYKFTKMVSDKQESVIDKFVTVLNAAYSSEATVVTMISGHKNRTDYYLGVVSKDISQEEQNIETQGETLKGVLTGNFPGVGIEPVIGQEKKRLLHNAFVYDYITAISGIASIRNKKDNTYEKFVQGIEHLTDSLQGREYSIVVIADSIDAYELAHTKLGYESLYTQLAPFLKTSMSLNASKSVTLTQSHTEGMTESIGESTSLAQNYSKTSGWSESSTDSRNMNVGMGSLSGLVQNIGVKTASILAGAVASTSVGQGKSQTTTENRSTTESFGSTVSENVSSGTSSSDTSSEAEGQTYGTTTQFFNENKTVKSLLGKIDQFLERLQECEAYGAFNCATYVISSDPETNAIAASGYNALMRGDNSSLQSSHINNWKVSDSSKEDCDNGTRIKKYLMNFSHPLFKNQINDNILFSPASIVNSYELAVNMALPKKSIQGLPVFEMASFGRNVYGIDESQTAVSKSTGIHLGKIYHMGVNQQVSLDLNLQSLAMHTFITGSTGSGKSNTVYCLLRELNKKKIRYLVVEPAKGEYKHVFGNTDADVYGTNPYVSPLLKINPFKFPQGIHVLEHIDRLIEIFNVCWPMYAAMPAVLKDAVERAYLHSGWNLNTSENKYADGLFPTFLDILEELNNVVMESAFSQEVKDNYLGSLATRIQSLTNGIYGKIFANDELGDEKLFDHNVIVDLSRVGSVETKSMIMGILVMRLQEYRMSTGRMNADLNHVTVLEEAHNLLKRTSTEQSSESSNLLGKSVEMLSNAIAEVRTYGEGFIIVDQAPGLLDMSVIRNTNTKIIMRLPDAGDRNLVGKSAGLNEDQIKELAKIPTGVAAVYQNNWIEPVLCQVDYKKTDEIYHKKSNVEKSTLKAKQNLIKRMLNKAAGEPLDINMDQIADEIIKLPLKTKVKTEAIQLLKRNGKIDLSDLSSVIYDLICTPEAEAESEKADSIEEWKNSILYAEGSMCLDLPEKMQNDIMECILREQIARYHKPNKYLEIWNQYIEGEVI